MIFVLRKIGGTFDACRLAGGMPCAEHVRRSPSFSATMSVFCMLLLPILVVLGAIAGTVAFGLHHAATPTMFASHLTGTGLALVPATVDLKKVHEDLQAATRNLREVNEQAIKERERNGAESAETKTKLDRIQAAMDGFEIKMQRALTGGRRGTDPEVTVSEKEAKEIKAFTKYIRTGDEVELKSLSTDSDPDGGFGTVPNTMSSRIINKLIQFSNVRSLATIETIAKGRGLDVPAEGAQNFDAGWVGERKTRSETNAGQLRMEQIPAHEMYAKPLISQTQLDDEAFDLETWSSDRVGMRLSVIEGTAFVNGSGSGQPEGFMTNTDVASVVSGAAAAITTDGMFDLLAALPTPYAIRASIVGNRKTKYSLRKLKDGQGRYLWEPNLQSGMPAAFDGTPFVELVDMPDVAANAYPVAAGDFKAAYTIVDRQGIRMIRDIYTSKPFVELYTTKRTGGQVVLAEAIRKLQCHT